MRKRWISIVLILSLILSQMVSAQGMEIDESCDYYGCFASRELAETMQGSLIERKMAEVQSQFGVSTFSNNIRPGDELFTIMPSTGSVKMLVLPIAYSDHADIQENYYDAETYETEMFFNEYDPDLDIYHQSVRGYYQWASNGRLDITGTILPVYTAPKPGAYYEKNVLEFDDMIGDALEYFVGQGLDLSEFDNDGDGMVDAIVAHSLANNSSGSVVWMNVIRGFENFERKIGDYYVGSIAHVTRSRGTLQTVRKTFCHEIGHLLGMDDHYMTIGCQLDSSLNEIMASSGQYINAYYKFLLDWIDPIILTNEDAVGRIELAPVEAYMTEESKKDTAVILIPEPTNLPFTEFYIAEYRTGGTNDPISWAIFDKSPGILIWHCDTYYDPARNDKQYYSSENFVKPIYKSGTAKYGEKDIYIVGDEFSSTSTINSNFYNGEYTGAYLKVEEITPEKAVLQAGFRNPNLEPGPTISFTKPSVSAIRSNETATFTMTVKSGSNIIPRNDYAREWARYPAFATGTLTGVGSLMYYQNNPMRIEYSPGDIGDSGEGMMWFDIPPGAVQYNAKDSPPAKSEVIYVDNTPPEITLRGDNPQKIQQGTAYTELGAIASDNLDPDIQDKLIINSTSVKTNVPGTYTVYYSVTDHVRYTATAQRTVIVEQSTMPHVHEFSTTWSIDATGHWQECKCGEKSGFETHSYSEGWNSDGTNHWRECSICHWKSGQAVHTAVIDPAVEATCTSPGKTQGSHCSDCGYVITAQETTPQKEHSYATTWSKDGTGHWHECSVCHGKKDQTAHTAVPDPAVEATCSTQGKTEGTHCSACGYVIKAQETTPQKEHSYATTWSKDGTGHWHECSVCHEKKDQTAHTAVPDPAVEATCSTQGKTAGSHCSVCEYVIQKQVTTQPLGHSYSAEWSQDKDNHWYECSRCQDKTELSSHIEGAGAVTKQPTQEETGIKTYSCSICGYEMRTETIPKLEPSHIHEYSTAWVSGTTGHWHECSCGEKADFAAHGQEIIHGVLPSCTQAGKTEGSRCPVCEKILTAQVTISATGHDISDEWHYGKIYEDDLGHWHECVNCQTMFDLEFHTEDGGTVTKEPTEEEEGLRVFTCVACGYQMRTEVIAKLESPHTHNYSEAWNSDGTNHWHECTVCKEKTAQAPHAWNGGKVTTAPTSTKTGVRTYTCTVCQRTRTESIPATGGASSSGGGSGGGGSSSGGGGGGSVAVEREYTVSIPGKTEGGSVKTDLQKAAKGKTVTLTVEPDPEHEPEQITVKDKNGKEVTLTKGKDGRYTFTMPGSNVEVAVSFKEIVPPEPPVEITPEPIKLPFTDVAETAWYYEVVQAVYEQGIMTGMTETLFEPELPTSRGMVVTMLYRMEGEPAAKSEETFTDVPVGRYYADAVAWCAEEDIVTGYGDGTFRPDVRITREQLVTIFYRYWAKKGYDVTGRADLSGFFDEGRITGYAREAMEWANATGLLHGADWGGIDPGGTATRGQVAAVLERLLAN